MERRNGNGEGRFFFSSIFFYFLSLSFLPLSFSLSVSFSFFFFRTYRQGGKTGVAMDGKRRDGERKVMIVWPEKNLKLQARFTLPPPPPPKTWPGDGCNKLIIHLS